MKHVIIGTAGHVDHGKTVLIKALTGMDTDRLQEEKRRGITIELGFAHLEFPDGTQAGIVDVPGHEKFIRHMLAGAGGMDLAMVVVAADEGIMPQTREHLDILSLLGVRDGLVVLTKTDLVDEPWLSMVTEEVRRETAGTFLEGKPICAVSARTGEGLEELKALLHSMVLEAAERDRRIPFRLPLDRVFSMEGFGTVVTGTLLEGAIHRDDSAALVPSGLEARVRGLQVHGKPVEAAYAGQRVAVNLAGVRKEQVSRGDTLCRPGSLSPSLMLDVRLEVLKRSGRTVINGSRVHLYHGVSTVLAKVVLLGREALEPGEQGYAQLRLAEPVAAKKGDRFVIRFYSPVETIGGGVILDEAPRKRKHGDPAAAAALEIWEKGSADQQLLQRLEESELCLPDREVLAPEPGQLEALCACGKIVEPLPGRYLSADRLEALRREAETLLGSYHQDHPLHAGMQTAELRQKLLPACDLQEANGILQLLVREGRLRRTGEAYALADFSVSLTRRQRHIREQLLHIYLEDGWHAPAGEEVLRRFEQKEREDCSRVLESLLSAGELVRLSAQVLCHRSWLEKAWNLALQQLSDYGELSLGTYRDLLRTSRDYALLMLEYFDRRKLTRREGNVRVLETGKF